MQSCWQHKDTARPSFSNIVSYLTSKLEYTSDYLDLTGLKNIPPTIKANADCSMDGSMPSNDSKSRLDALSHALVSTNDYYIAI